MIKAVVSTAGLPMIVANYRAMGIYMIVGASSVYVPSEQTKYMDIAVARRWTNLQGEEEYMTPGEAARCELRRAFPDLVRVGWFRGHTKLFDWSPPLMLWDFAKGHLIYIDLVSAYWTIYQRLWLDIAFPRSLGGQYPLWDVAARLQDWKMARNSLMGIVRSRSARAIKDGRDIRLSPTNPFLSPGLWATVQATLHMIATAAIDRGAVYINTDGYIFQSTNDADRFMQWLLSHNLNFKIRAQGDGEILGWSNYRVGNLSTQLYKINTLSSTRRFSNVRQQDHSAWVEWWRRVSDPIRSGQG